MSDLSKLGVSVLVGVDWADSKHDVCLQTAGGEREFAQIEHGAESLDEWIQALQQRFSGQIGIVVELTRGPLVYALQKYDFLTLFPVHPGSLARYRESMTSSGAKDDPTDAALALDLVLRHPEKFTPLTPQSPMMRELTYLVEQRRRFVDDKIRISNRLTNCFKQYYPQVLQWFERHDTTLFCDFVSRWPSLQQARQARRATLERFFRAHRGNRLKLMEQRIEAIKSAVPLTEDDAVIRAHRMQAELLIEQLRVAMNAVKQYDQAITELTVQHADFEIFDALPGAGSTIAPRLMTAMGEQRDRFNGASEVQMCVSIAPVLKRSGKKRQVTWRNQGSTFLRQTFIEWASQSIHHSYWARAYYDEQRARGKTHNVAIRALAFKWIRILYRCWKDRTPYDESRYLTALKDRGSPLMAA